MCALRGEGERDIRTSPPLADKCGKEKTVNIPRMEVADVTLTEEREQLVQQFRKTFYVDSVKMAGQPPVGAANMLMKLGITPLQPGAVQEYKTRTANRAQLMANKGRNLAILWAIMGAPVCVGIGIRLSQHDSARTAALLVGLAILTIGCWIGLSETEKIEMRWVNTPVNQWTHPLPDFVMATAIRVKAETGNIPRVEYLEARRSERRDPDPFLFVEVEGTVVYLEVWDEREFERKL